MSRKPAMRIVDLAKIKTAQDHAINRWRKQAQLLLVFKIHPERLKLPELKRLLMSLKCLHSFFGRLCESTISDSMGHWEQAVEDYIERKFQ